MKMNMRNGDNTFTLDDIHEAFKKVRSGADFPQLVQDLKKIGVTYYDNFVEDGRTTYFGTNGFAVNGEHKYASLAVDNNGSPDKLKHAIQIHQQGQTDYPTFCNQAASAGVERWTTHMLEMTVTYIDTHGNKLAVEPIPHV